MAGISIAVAADTRDFVKGVGGDMPKALEKTADALDSLAKDGAKAGDNLERGMRDAQKATEKAEDEFKQLARAQKKAADEGGEGFSRATRKSTEEAGGAIHEFGDEAKQNIGETFSSFRGDAQDFAQVIQDTLGGLTTGLEGIPGIAAVAAGAAGIGLIMGAIENADQASQQWRQDVADIATDLIENGSKAVPSIGYIADALKQAATNADGTGLTLKSVRDEAEKLKVPFGLLARAKVGSKEDLDAQIKGLKRLRDEAQGAGQDYGNFASAMGNTSRGSKAAIQDQIDDLEKVRKKTKEAAEEQREWAAAGGPQLEAKAKLVDNLNDSYDSAAGAVDDYVDAETGVFNVDAYIDAMQQKQTALKEYQDNLKSLGGQLGPEATGYLEGLGADQASILLDSYKKATPAQQAQMAAIWAEAGKTNSADYMSNFTAGLPKTVDGPSIKVTVDDSDYAAFKRNFGNPLYQPVILQRPGSAVQ